MGTRSGTRIGLLCAAVAGVSAGLYAWNFRGEGPEDTAVVLAATAEPKPQPKPPPERESLARAAAEPFAEAAAVRSAGGVLRATLVVKYGDNVIRGSRVRLRCYNGRLVGPTLRARPGDVLQVRVENRLPPLAEPPVHAVNVPHALNSTNLH